jgi:hypothetical protein
MTCLIPDAKCAAVLLDCLPWFVLPDELLDKSLLAKLSPIAAASGLDVDADDEELAVLLSNAPLTMPPILETRSEALDEFCDACFAAAITA